MLERTLNNFYLHPSYVLTPLISFTITCTPTWEVATQLGVSNQTLSVYKLVLLYILSHTDILKHNTTMILKVQPLPHIIGGTFKYVSIE